MSNFQSPFRDMVSVPSQLSATAFGSSSNSTNAFSGSQSPFAFSGGSGSGGLGPSQSSSSLGQSAHQRPTTLGGMGGLFGNIGGGGSIGFGAAGRSMTPNPSSGPPPGLFQQQSTPQQALPPSILTPTGQQPPPQHSPGGGAVPPLLSGPPPSASRNLLPTLLNGVGGNSGPGSSSSGMPPLGAPSSSQGSLGGSNAMANFFSHGGPGGLGAGNSSTSNFSFGGSPVRAISSLGALQSSGQHKQAPTSGISGLLSIASGKDALLSLRGSGGSSYENDFLHSSSPFSMSSTSAMGMPHPIGAGLPLKGDSSSGNQQQAATAAALALINRYTGGGLKGFSDFHPSHYQTALGHHNSSTTPLGFNENEFPSLSAPSPMINRGAAGFGSIPPPGPIGSSFGSSRSAAGAGARSAYANLMKQTVDPQPEFQIHNEDFPALPGSQETANKINSPSATASGDALKDARFSGDGRAQQLQTPKRGIQTHPDGTVSGIPAGMLNDQFGMVGLLTFLRAIETDPSIVSLALGHDLTQLGLNLNAPEKNLYQTFGGPWSDVPCRPQDIDCHVPSEYMTNAAIADKLAPIKLNRYGEDLLFYLFYNFGGEMFQLAAAAELYNRDWRYHKEERVWLSRAPGMVPLEKSSNYERGTYYVFDPSHWRKIAKEMHLEYDKLEERPMLPPQLQQPQHLPPSQSLPAPQQPSQSNMVVTGAAQTS